MTSRVTVDAHAGWSVEVKQYDVTGGEIKDPILIGTEVVAAGTEREFHVWDDRFLIIKELRDG